MSTTGPEADPATAAGSAPADVTGVRALIEAGRFAEAVRAADVQLRTTADRDDRVDLLYMRAVAHRYAGNVPAARDSLATLEAEAPEYPRLHQERGHLERSLGHADDALAAYQRATTLDPALVASWRAIGELEHAAGRPEAAARAREKMQRLAALPPELLSATSHLNENRLHRAEQICRAFLKRNRTHVEGMRLLAQIATRLKIYDDAEFLLETCLEIQPGHVAARVEYLNLLIRKQRFEAAHREARRLLADEPGNISFRSSMAATLVGLGRFDEGIALYRELLAEVPDRAQLHLMLGHAFKTVGRLDEAVAAYRRAYGLRPDFGDAFWSLANTKTYRFTDAELAHMRRHEAASGTRREDRIHFCFATGKALEDAGEYAEAFDYYERGNALKRAETGYRDATLQHQVQAQIDTCTPALFERHAGAGCHAADPIFIVGLPRAGSTLLEQILASHPQVDATMELHNILALAQRLNGRSAAREARYPAVLETLGVEQLREYGERFLADTQVYRGDAPRFIDKMPNNFLHVGLIRLILPNAKVIDARRHPLACCFSGFKQLFGEGQEFTYGLHEIGRYYNAYVRLMDHWDRVLPGFVLRVMHEDVVDDLEREVRRLLDFCGLPFDPACLEFHRTERSVRTPSSEQVRQPIYRSAVEQWRHFEPWLAPLKTALGPEILERYPPTD